MATSSIINYLIDNNISLKIIMIGGSGIIYLLSLIASNFLKGKIIKINFNIKKNDIF
jgi:hypothetical protein